MKKKSWLFGNIHPAVIAVWAALLAASRFIPSLPIIGTTSTFSVGSALIPLAGVFFGPIPGAICAAIGGFIGYMLVPTGAWLGPFTFLIGTFNALTSGLVSRGKWPYAAMLIGIGTILWFVNPIGQSVPLLPIVFYGLGLVAIIVGGIFAKKWLYNGNVILKSIAVFLCAFAGLVTAASLANFGTLTIMKTPAEIWSVLVFTAPLERAVFSLGSCLVGVPLLTFLPKVGIYVGTDDANDEN